MSLLVHNSTFVKSPCSQPYHEKILTPYKTQQRLCYTHIFHHTVPVIRVKEEHDPTLALLSKRTTATSPIIRSLEQALLNEKRKIEEQCRRYGAKKETAPTIMDMQSLAAIWTLEGTVWETINKSNVPVHLEGMNIPKALLLFRKQLLSFLQTENAPQLTFSEQLILQDTIDKVALGSLSTQSEKRERIKEGFPLLLLKGFVKQWHVVGFVFHNNHLLVCNRGYGATSHAISIYTIRSELLRENFFTRLDNEMDIDRLPLLLKSIGAKKQGGIKQKFQTVNNCPWASTKSAFLALLYSLFESTEKTHANRLHRAKIFYKAFTSFSRQHILDTYLHMNDSPNQRLLQKVENKLLTTHRFSRSTHSILLQSIREKTPQEDLPF